MTASGLYLRRLMLLVQLSLLCINSRNLINMEINQSRMQIHAKEFNFPSCSTNPFQVPNVFYTLKSPIPSTSQPALFTMALSLVYFSSFLSRFLKSGDGRTFEDKTLSDKSNFISFPSFTFWFFFRSLNLSLLSSYFFCLVTKIALIGIIKLRAKERTDILQAFLCH